MSDIDDEGVEREIDRIEAEIGTGADLESIAKFGPTRLEAILKAWDSGLDFWEIARRFDMRSPQAARATVERALAASGSENIDRDALRNQIARVLDRHHQTAYEHAVNPADRDQGSWLKLDVSILERKAKLLGLDAPQVLAIIPATDEAARYEYLLAIAAGAKSDQEADPFEGVPDEPERLRGDEPGAA